MKTIKKPYGRVIKMWGSPRGEDRDYRLIDYHLTAACDDGVLLHNNVTGEMLLLTPQEADFLKSLPGKVPVEYQPLIASHFLVPVDFDEKKSVNQLRLLCRRFGRKDTVDAYTILPTTACNARCFYCYEADFPHHTMTEEVAHKTVEYIAAHCSGKKSVSLSWFGGEPLLGAQRISQICDELRARGISFHSSMISNSYLFTDELLETAKEKWKLNNIQVTLDGTEEIYNKTKAYVNVEDNPYQRLMKNIRGLLDKEIRVSVRMNLDKHNAGDLQLLVDELAERFSEDEFFSAYVGILFDDCGFTPIHHTDSDRDDLVRIRDDLMMRLKNNGCRVSKRSELPMLKTWYCMADNPASCLVNPLGGLGKCEHHIYTRQVGNICDGITDSREYDRFMTHKEWEQCGHCALYPSCFITEGCEINNACLDCELLSKMKDYRKNMLVEYEARKNSNDLCEGGENCERV